MGMQMIVHERHPLDGVLADLGTLVRRVLAGTLVEADYRQISDRIRSDMVELDADPDGCIARRFDLLEQAEEAGRLTPRLFRETAAAIRVALLVRRSQPMDVVPNFAVLPSGIHGRRIGRFTVIDGTASTPPETTLKGA